MEGNLSSLNSEKTIIATEWIYMNWDLSDYVMLVARSAWQAMAGGQFKTAADVVIWRVKVYGTLYIWLNSALSSYTLLYIEIVLAGSSGGQL